MKERPKGRAIGKEKEAAARQVTAPSERKDAKQQSKASDVSREIHEASRARNAARLQDKTHTPHPEPQEGRDFARATLLNRTRRRYGRIQAL